MLYAYALKGNHLQRLDGMEALASALWIDLYRPMPEQVEAVEDLGVEVPTLADMEEIEISNRLYRDDGTDVMTVVLPGLSTTKAPTAGPVTFMLSKDRLVTVRHHAPRPFETFPDRADKSVTGCATPDRILIGLVEEIVARLADLLEGVGRGLDDVSMRVFSSEEQLQHQDLLAMLQRIGREGDLMARVRLALLTLERMLTYFGQSTGTRDEGKALRDAIKAQTRDIQALEVHADFLSSRIGLATDATLGMVNLQQNATVRILSVVAALFLPPTLIASIYGMNFAHMPELAWPLGYPAALLLMGISSLATWMWFKWRKWL